MESVSMPPVAAISEDPQLSGGLSSLSPADGDVRLSPVLTQRQRSPMVISPEATMDKTVSAFDMRILRQFVCLVILSSLTVTVAVDFTSSASAPISSPTMSMADQTQQVSVRDDVASTSDDPQSCGGIPSSLSPDEAVDRLVALTQRQRHHLLYRGIAWLVVGLIHVAREDPVASLGGCSDEFRPLVHRLPEFNFWRSVFRSDGVEGLLPSGFSTTSSISVAALLGFYDVTTLNLSWVASLLYTVYNGGCVLTTTAVLWKEPPWKPPWISSLRRRGWFGIEDEDHLRLHEESFASYSLIRYLWYQTVKCRWYSWMRRWSSSEDVFSLWYADVLRVADIWISQSLFLMDESIFWILHRLSIDPDWEMANVIQQRKLVFKMGQDVKLPRKITELKLCYLRRSFQQHLPILLQLISYFYLIFLFMYVVLLLFYVFSIVILHSS